MDNDTEIDRAKAAALVIVSMPVMVFSLLFLIGCFTAGSTNPIDWTAESRWVLVIFWFVLSILTIAISFCWLNDLRGQDRRLREAEQQRDQAYLKCSQLTRELATYLNKQDDGHTS